MPNQKKRTLFIGTTDYDSRKENKTLEKKWGGLSRELDVYVLARGPVWRARQYGCRFYLTPKWFGKAGMPLYLFITFFRGLFLVYAKKIDVIVAQSPGFDGVVAAKLKLLTRRELIVEVHGDWIESPFYYFNIPLKPAVKKVLSWMGGFSLKRADKVRVISSATEKLARRFSGTKPYFRFPTFTDIDMFRDETVITYRPVIMYAGWLYRLKGLQFLIEAFARLRKRYPNFELLVVGDGPFRRELEAQARDHGIKHIEFTGWQPQDKVKEAMRSCSVFVLPSLSEGLGRVLIEAAMLRKPCVGSAVDGIPDLIRDNETGFLFPPGDVDALTDRLDRLMGSPDLVKRMGEKARAFVENEYSVGKYLREYVGMIDDIENRKQKADDRS